MHSSTVALMPWTQEPGRQRSSFSSRVSSLFGQRSANTTSLQSPRATTTFSVPLFLSPTRYDPRRDPDADESSDQERTPVADCFTEAIPVPNRIVSSVYSNPETLASHEHLVSQPARTTSAVASSAQSHTAPETARTSTSRHKKRRAVQHRRKRKVSSKSQIQTAKHLSFAFSITFLLSVVTYLVLATTGVASGTVFHVILILLLLILFGVFLHSACRWYMLSRRRKARRQQKVTRGQWYGRTDGDLESGECTAWNGDLFAEHAPDKPIQIIMKEDALSPGPQCGPMSKLQQPPPVYGNFRESMRINPNLIHWQKVPPSPLTPTYAEAMNDVQRAMGYRPPSYIQSDCDATQVIENRRMDVDGALENIQPLAQRSAGH